MNHDEIRAALPLYLTGDLEAVAEAQVAEHLESCDDCADELLALAGLAAGVEALGSTTPSATGKRPSMVGLIRAAAILGAFLLGMGTQALRSDDVPRSAATVQQQEKIEAATPHDLARIWRETEPASSGLARVLLARRQLR